VRLVVLAILLLLPRSAAAQTCGPCTLPVRPPASGELTAVAALPGPGRRLVAVSGDSVVHTVDGGARWLQRAAVERAGELPCGAALAASEHHVVVIDEESLLWSDDGARSFERYPTPFETQPCSVAIAGGSRVVAIDDGGIATVAVGRSGPAGAERHQPPFEPTLVAAAGGLTVILGQGTIFARHSGDGEFEPVLEVGAPMTVRALAVDRSGDIWLATSTGLFVSDGDGALETVLGQGLASSTVALAAADGDVVYVLREDGQLGQLRPVCPCAGELPPPAPLRRRSSGRPVAVAGLLPTVELSMRLSPGRRSVWVALVWPLPAGESTAVAGWQALAVEGSEELARRRAAAAMAQRHQMLLGGSLGAPWPPPVGDDSVGRAVSAMEAARVHALWSEE